MRLLNEGNRNDLPLPLFSYLTHIIYFNLISYHFIYSNLLSFSFICSPIYSNIVFVPHLPYMIAAIAAPIIGANQNLIPEEKCREGNKK